MESDALLDLLDDARRSQAFELCFRKLEDSPGLQANALKICLQLLPRTNGQVQDADRNVLPSERLLNLVTSRIPHHSKDVNHLYKLTEILFSDEVFVEALFQHRIWPILDDLYLEISRLDMSKDDLSEAEQSILYKTRAFLMLVQTSFWLPSHQNHVLDPGTLKRLSRFIGIPSVADQAHDALSALFALLKRKDSIVVAHSAEPLPSWLQKDSTSERKVLCTSVVDQSLWQELCVLPKEFFRINASKVFRTWFQWISQIQADNVHLDCLNDDIYWQRVQLGLLHGFADQRKYCIGIIRQSLLASQNDISTPAVCFEIASRDVYLNAYEQFSVLFEIIVLDRYANQVQACLPELSALFKSKVTPSMITILLTAALNPSVQEGVRKTIGNWFIDYVVKHHGEIKGYSTFLLSGFIPWATIGELFTSSLVSTRTTTHCAHGAALAQVVSRFICEGSSESVSDPGESSLTHDDVLIGIVDFVLATGGRLFQASVLYLLEGVVLGLEALQKSSALSHPLSKDELGKILQLSRLPGLPEVSSDLYSQYCYRIYNLVTTNHEMNYSSGYKQLKARAEALSRPIRDGGSVYNKSEQEYDSPVSFAEMVRQLDSSRHKSIQGKNYIIACMRISLLLEQADDATLDLANLYRCLEAIWEEADRREFARAVSIHLPPILFHRTCIRACASKHEASTQDPNVDLLCRLLSKAIKNLQRLSEGRPYITSGLATCLRKAVLCEKRTFSILPIEDYIVQFINVPPAAKVEFLFEVAAAEKLQQYYPHRSYSCYYGEREWSAYAAIIDLIQCLPSGRHDVAQAILDRLLTPWRDQRKGGPIISKWKNVLQLQAMLLLSDAIISIEEVDAYLAAFRNALVLEAWPRYRFSLEWILARIYCRHPDKAMCLLDDLRQLDENSATQIASLMKLAVLVAPYQPETFSTSFMTQLVPFAASPKVQMRHESNYAIPIILDLAKAKGWKSITENPGFVSLDAFIRRLDKFNVAPWTIRTLKLDAINDFTLVNVFQGPYLTIESPEKQRVAYDDFVALYESDRTTGLDLPSPCITLGTPPSAAHVPTSETDPVVPPANTSASPAFFQTKSGFDIDSLHPISGSPDSINQRPASVILIASLIDNPTNLGGLSRISESFGLEALYIDDLKKMAHKDFKATSVTSEKHFPIHQLKPVGLPEFLLDAKAKGYEVVGIEQTDRSGILGTEETPSSGGEVVTDSVKERGTLPKKCVLVLGSEKGGITAEVLAVLDRCVEIRTVGVTRSLNVQTAGGIAVYEWWREWYGRG